MIYWIIVLVVWLIGILVTYQITKKWENNTKFEKVYFACLWPLMIPLYIIHWLHMNL